MSPVRTLVAFVPHWPVLAAGHRPDEAVVVVYANRVVAASPAAGHHGVRVGLRRREAQGRCPHVTVVEADPARDARRFEPLIAALEVLTPRIEVVEPGWCSFPTRGPSRYFGGDDALAVQAAGLVDAALAAHLGVTPTDLAPAVRTRVGVADGPFAAEVAARCGQVATDASPVVVVPPGGSAGFLAPLPVSVLGHRGFDRISHVSSATDGESLVDLLWRLGLTDLGSIATVAPADLLARFGDDGVIAHRLAAGLDPTPPDTRPVPPELHVESELDPPAQRVDTAAFVAKTLSDELHARLAADGLACTRVLVEAQTDHGEHLARSWRHEGSLRPGDIADRVRWQLDGWLHGRVRGASDTTAGIVLLRLTPTEVVAEVGRQLGFWGGETEAARRAARAVARVQGIVGVEGVTVPELRGGRAPGERAGRLPAASVDLTAEDRPVATPTARAEPWPGHLPAPAPTRIHLTPVEVDVVDAGGVAVGVSARGELSAPPARVRSSTGRDGEVTAWAGPWPSDERWWDPSSHRRRARLQVVIDDGVAHLLTIEGGTWRIEATYD